MTNFITRANKSQTKASQYFLKLYAELDMSKYKLEKYRELFRLASFQEMHDADLAYFDIYQKCSQNASTKESVLLCLAQEEVLSLKNPHSFDDHTYRKHVLKAISEIRDHIKKGDLDYLYS